MEGRAREGKRKRERKEGHTSDEGGRFHAEIFYYTHLGLKKIRVRVRNVIVDQKIFGIKFHGGPTSVPSR
jgi:hypothetical protein